MDKDDVYRTINELSNSMPIRDLLIKDRLMNYLEANIDEFIECYEELEE